MLQKPLSSYALACLAALVVVAAMVGAMVAYENSVAEANPNVYLPDGALSDTQKKSIDVLLDLSNILIAWAIAVIGATGFFLKLNIERELPVRRIDLLISFAIILLCVWSLFFGHLGIDKISQILALDQFPIRDRDVRQVLRHQYLSGLAAIGLFGFHVIQFFWARRSG